MFWYHDILFHNYTLFFTLPTSIYSVIFTQYQYQNSTMLGFETITLVPYEPNLIKYELLSDAQVRLVHTE